MTKFYLFTILLLCGIFTAPVIGRKGRRPHPTHTHNKIHNKVQTAELDPQEYHVTLEDLPEPFATVSSAKSAVVEPIPENATLNVPKGFSVNVYAEGLNGPRWLQLTPTGEVLVTITSENRILIMKDSNRDGVADNQNETFAGPENGLNRPFGMAFSEGYFYLGNIDEVRRYPYARDQRRIEGTGEKIADLPGGDGHWTRNVIVSPDEKYLYVSVGSASNVDEEPLPRASVIRMNLDGSDQETFAFGLRNPNGLSFHPVTGDLYTVVNERDELGDDLVPDYFTRIQEGEFFGWPYAYLSPDNIDPRRVDEDGNSQAPELVAQTKTPDVLFNAHSAPLGMGFYTGNTFPKKYRSGAFVNLRGSWNRNEGTGYKVVFVPFGDDNRPTGNYEDFLTGFVIDATVPSVWGRPVGLKILKDGSLLFADEPNGRLYRVQYQRKH